MRVLVVNPVGTDRWDEIDKRLFVSYASPETIVDVVSLDSGPEGIESRKVYAEVLPLIVEKVHSLSKGYDGIIVNCFADPAVDALKPLLNMPVVGPCEASLALASILGGRFAIVSTVGNAIGLIEERVRVIGYENRVKAIRSIGIHALDLNRDLDYTKSKLVEECRKAIRDGAEIIVLGCTSLVELSEFVQKQLDVTVINPSAAALKVLEALFKLKVIQSATS